MNECEEQRELTSPGMEHGDLLRSAISRLIAIDPGAEVVISLEQLPGLTFDTDALIGVFADEVMVVVMRRACLVRIATPQELAQDPSDRDGLRAHDAVALHQPPEDQRRNDPCHQNHRKHADDGDLGEGMEGRMLGDNQRAHADKHDEGGDDDAVLKRGQQLLLIGKLVDQAVGDKDRVVVALSEDEGGQDDVDDIELHAQHAHDAQDPDPSQGHGEEGQQTQLQPSEGDPKEEEDNESAGETDIVEVA